MWCGIKLLIATLECAAKRGNSVSLNNFCHFFPFLPHQSHRTLVPICSLPYLPLSNLVLSLVFCPSPPSLFAYHHRRSKTETTRSTACCQPVLSQTLAPQPLINLNKTKSSPPLTTSLPWLTWISYFITHSGTRTPKTAQKPGSPPIFCSSHLATITYEEL